MNFISSQQKKIGNNKSGISFIVLLLSMVIILVLVTVSVIQARRIIDNANISAFAKDIKVVSEEAQRYYYNNGTFPTFADESSGIIYSDLIGKVSSLKKNYLIEELNINRDYDPTGTSTIFYSVDLEKLNITKATLGTKKNNAVNDVYYIAYPSLHVYYLDPIRIKSGYFFSLEAKLSSVSETAYSTNIVQETRTGGEIKIIKDKNVWSNDINLYIDAGINDAFENMYIFMPGFTAEKRITNLAQGRNYLNYNISNLLDNTYSSTFSSALTSTEISTFLNTSQKDKYIEFIKKYNTTEVERIRIGLSNFDRVAPSLISSNYEAIAGSNPPVGELTVVASDDISGVGSVRYEYLYEGSVPYFTGVTSFDENYMKNFSKTATKLSEGTYIMQIPSTITAVSICIFDKAGNSKIVDDIKLGS